MTQALRIAVRDEMDTTKAVLQAVEQAKLAGFDEVLGKMIATAVSELARNILNHAGSGEIRLRVLAERGRYGIEIEARDRGPGIPDVEQAMSDHYSTAGTLGLIRFIFCSGFPRRSTKVLSGLRNLPAYTFCDLRGLVFRSLNALSPYCTPAKNACMP